MLNQSRLIHYLKPNTSDFDANHRLTMSHGLDSVAMHRKDSHPLDLFTPWKFESGLQISNMAEATPIFGTPYFRPFVAMNMYTID